MATVYERKLRGLFVLETDTYFTQDHPLWKTIETFRPYVGEIHVAAFSKKSVAPEYRSREHDAQCLIYHFCAAEWWRFGSIARELRFHLMWHKEFRPDFILSFSEGMGALVGSALAHRYDKKFFQVTTLRTRTLLKHSLRFFYLKYLLRRATAVFVPGPEAGKHIAETFQIPPAAVMPVEPPIAISKLISDKTKYNFHSEHPQYNFFLSTVVYGTRVPPEVVLVYKKIAEKYPRTALVIFTEERAVRDLKRWIEKHKMFGMMVYPKHDDFSSLLAGTHVYLALTREEDIDMNMLTALGLQVPVVAKSYGIAQEVFTESVYKKFLIDSENTDQIAHTVLALVEDQYLRANYALNTTTLFAKLSFNTTERYVEKIYHLIEGMVRPDLPAIVPDSNG